MTNVAKQPPATITGLGSFAVNYRGTDSYSCCFLLFLYKIDYMPKFIIGFTLAGFLFLLACNNQQGTPRPYGYKRIALPEKSYQTLPDTFPFQFDYPEYGKLLPDTSAQAKQGWFNIAFPDYNGTLYFSYHPVENNLMQFIEDAHSMAYKHAVKADAIDEELIYEPDEELFGIIYRIKGNAASASQFFVTDSTSHFLRGTLYFNTTPNKDSLAPVIHYFHEDVLHLVESFRWNKANQ